MSDTKQITLSAEDAQEIAWGDYCEKLAEQEVSKHRWYTKKLIAFQDTAGEVMPDADLYGFYYLDPASELQEGQERFESDPVPVFKVKAEVVSTTIYAVAA